MKPKNKDKMDPKRVNYIVKYHMPVLYHFIETEAAKPLVYPHFDMFRERWVKSNKDGALVRRRNTVIHPDLVAGYWKARFVSAAKNISKWVKK